MAEILSVAENSDSENENSEIPKVTQLSGIKLPE